MERKRERPGESVDEGFSFSKIKKRKAVVIRTYPSGCGFHADDEMWQCAFPKQHGSGKDVGVYATRTFPKGCGRNVPLCNPVLQRKLSGGEDGKQDVSFVGPDSPGYPENSLVSKAVEAAQAGTLRLGEVENLNSETQNPSEVDELKGSAPMVTGGLVGTNSHKQCGSPCVPAETAVISVPEEARDSLLAPEFETTELLDQKEAPASGNSFIAEAVEHSLLATKPETTESLDKKEAPDSFMGQAIEDGTLVPDEALRLLLAIKSETTESLDRKEAPDTGDAFMAEAVNEVITTVPDESPCSLEYLTSQTKTELDQSKAPELLRSFKTQELGQPERLFPCRIEEVSVYLKLPRRRMSSERHFPAGCGRIAITRLLEKCAKQAECSIYSKSGDEKSNGGNGVELIARANGKERRVVENEDTLKGKLKGYAMRGAALTQSGHARDSFDCKLKRNDGIKDAGRACGMNVNLNNEMSLKRNIPCKSLDGSYSKNQHESVKGSTSELSYRKKNKEDNDSVSLHNEAEVVREKAAREKVNKARNMFSLICEELLRDKEAKRNNIRRIDCEAAKILKERNKWVNSGEPVLGVVPGVKVGDKFRYRAEVAIVGLHRHYQSGIDYLKRWDGKELATSIVASGGYDDYKCGSDVIVYSGQGGNPGQGKEATDQKLEKGNLALKNSKDEQTPVRVIRGVSETKGRGSMGSRINTGATLTYDGLYLVEDYWPSEGRHGKNVFMFQLRRMPGQPELPKD